MGTGSQQADFSRIGGRIRSFVFDVENGRHFIAISGRKPTRRKGTIPDQIRIGKGQTLLLTSADQLRPIDLKVVDVYQIFIVVSTSDVVLAAQFPPRTATDSKGYVEQNIFQIARD